MESSGIKVRTLSIASSVLLLIVLVLVNAVFARSSARLDLTEEKLYTLSDGSRTVLEGLEDPATIKVFWHNVPASFSRTKHYIEGLLDEMSDAAEDGLQVQWVDMEEDAGVEDAQRMGVQEYIFGDVRGDEVRQSQGYMSLAIELGEGEPLILDRLHDQRDQLEYRVVAELHKRSRIATPVVGLIAGDAKFFMGPAPRMFQNLNTILQETYGTAYRPKLSMEKPVPPDVEVLIVVAPKDWDEVKAYNLEQFVLRGGKLLLLLDPVGVEVLYGRGSTGQPTRSGLETWLEHLGISVDTGVAGDFRDHGVFVIEGLRRYPYWPIATSADADKTNPVARSLQPMLMRWPVGFSIDDKKQKDANRTVSVLASTSENGYRRPDLMGLTRSIDSPEGKLLEQIPMILLVEGAMQSHWNDKPLPEPEEAPPPPGAFPELPGADDDAGSDDASGSPDGPTDDGDEATGSPDGATDDGEDATGSPDGDPAPDAPKEDAPKPEPKKDAPKGDQPKGDAPKGDEPKQDPPKDPEPATDGAPGPAGDDEEDAPADPDGGAADDGEEPGDGEEPDAGDAPDGAPKKEDRSNHLTKGTGRIIVAGDAGIVSDQWLPRRGADQVIYLLAQFNGRNGVAGFNLVRNATDWLTGSEELLALRSRNDNPRTLDKLEEEDQEFLSWFNILLVPLLVLIAGLVVFVVRRR